ncbi:cyclin-dependent kinases regulatory subunit 2-like [Pleuronectes platessa]|uniref:cyclin-dependent kinases regulatory subunit 2-like n=1 Tax=Pleuronectes platessa TaxID=8262 RepID=UPI00232A54FA|nr:cyclin-dependent kinases regulatory subunit 2-like [Pleuronectes platessa]
MSHNKICYPDRYSDELCEYRHVVLPRKMVQYVLRSHLMSDDEWRQLGVQQSKGWVHYMVHKPEPQILLFRKPLPNH